MTYYSIERTLYTRIETFTIGIPIIEITPISRLVESELILSSIFGYQDLSIEQIRFAL